MDNIHDRAALEKLRRRWRVEPNHLRQLRNAFYKKQQTAEAALDVLPKAARAAFAGGVAFHALELHSRHDSQLDGASKLIFRTQSGHLIESVILRIHSGRTSLCVSSQVGCAVRCRFCATGQMGLAVPLSRDEILDQVIQANQLLRAEGRSIRNVVFMGMGEPLHNEAEVYPAVEVLLSPQCFALSPARILISTVGIPAAMLRCAKRFPQLRMAVSLHSARQEERERIIPLARRYPLDMLHRTMTEVAAIQRQPLLVEYLLLAGLNDTDQDLAALIAYLRDIPVHINLIPYNTIDETPDLRSTPESPSPLHSGERGWGEGPIYDGKTITPGPSPPQVEGRGELIGLPLRGTPADRRREFAESLTAAGFVVTVRYSLGADIRAACGQLVQRENAISLGSSQANPGFLDSRRP